MKPTILKSLQTNALSTREIVDYVIKHRPMNIGDLQYKSQIASATSGLKAQGKLIYHRGRYRKVGKEVQEWYYNLTGQEADRIKKLENVSAADPSKKELADLYTKYHLNRLNLTPQLIKQ